jgi:Na+-transporting methylmalonyl-CoA/oxaloacetate decarboxylase gamma subunit
MRMVFGVLSLLIVVAIVGIVAKNQLNSFKAPAASTQAVPGVAAPTGTPKQQVEQMKQSIESAIQQAPRQSSDDTK